METPTCCSCHIFKEGKDASLENLLLYIKVEVTVSCFKMFRVLLDKGTVLLKISTTLHFDGWGVTYLTTFNDFGGGGGGVRG